MTLICKETPLIIPGIVVLNYYILLVGV